MVNVIPPILISGNMLRQRKSLHAHLIVANTAFLTHSPRRCTCRGRIYRNWRVWSDIFLRTALIYTRMKVVGSIMSPFGCILVVNRCCSSCFLIIAAICGARSLFLAAIFTSRGLCRGIGSKRMRRRWFWCGTGSADSMVSTCTFGSIFRRPDMIAVCAGTLGRRWWVSCWVLCCQRRRHQTDDHHQRQKKRRDTFFP